MKKLILVLFLILGVLHLKAQQQLLPVKPLDSLSNKMDFNIKPDFDLRFLQPQTSLSQPITAALGSLNEVKFGSRMPVVVLDGYDRMPIVKLDGYSKMPIVWIDPVDPLSNSAEVFKTP